MEKLKNEIDKYSDDFLDGLFKEDIYDRVYEVDYGNLMRFLFNDTDEEIRVDMEEGIIDYTDVFAESGTYVVTGNTLEECLSYSLTLAHVTADEEKSNKIDGWDFVVLKSNNNSGINYVFVERGDYDIAKILDGKKINLN